jgi:hypothetical protein
VVVGVSVQHVSVATPQPNDDREIPLAYYRVPDSWLDAPGAVNQAPDDADAVRLYAVSAAHGGDWLFTRYVHPRGGVKTLLTEATDGTNGWYPRALERDSPANWPRSIVPTVDDESDGEYRGPELDWLDELWRDRDVFQAEVMA